MAHSTFETRRDTTNTRLMGSCCHPSCQLLNAQLKHLHSRPRHVAVRRHVQCSHQAACTTPQPCTPCHTGIFMHPRRRHQHVLGRAAGYVTVPVATCASAANRAQVQTLHAPNCNGKSSQGSKCPCCGRHNMTQHNQHPPATGHKYSRARYHTAGLLHICTVHSKMRAQLLLTHCLPGCAPDQRHTSRQLHAMHPAQRHLSQVRMQQSHRKAGSHSLQTIATTPSGAAVPLLQQHKLQHNLHTTLLTCMHLQRLLCTPPGMQVGSRSHHVCKLSTRNGLSVQNTLNPARITLRRAPTARV